MKLHARVKRLEQDRARRAPAPCPHCGGKGTADHMVAPGQRPPEPWCPRCGMRVAWTPVPMPDDVAALMGLDQ